MLSNHPDHVLWSTRRAYLEAHAAADRAYEAFDSNRTPETTAARERTRDAMLKARRAFLLCPARTTEGALRKLEDYCIEPGKRAELLHELESDSGMVADEAVVSAVIRDLEAIVEAETAKRALASNFDGPEPLIALGERWHAALAVRDEALKAQAEAETGFGFGSEQAEATVARVENANRACIDLECEIATTPARTSAGMRVKRDVVKQWFQGDAMPPFKATEAFGVDSMNEMIVEMLFRLGCEAAFIEQHLDPDPKGLDDDLGGLMTAWHAHRQQSEEPKWRPDPEGDPTPEYHDRLSEFEEAIIAAEAHTVSGLAYKAEFVVYLLELFDKSDIDCRAALDLAQQVRKVAGGAS